MANDLLEDFDFRELMQRGLSLALSQVIEKQFIVPVPITRLVDRKQ
jgi:hypothetical protein